jgi:hypothetical protein
MQNFTTGFGDFSRVREENYYYVDKSMFIHELVSYQESVALFTRPRRFGKTMNLTMIRDFFDITKDSRKLFEGLAVMETHKKIA